MTAVPEILVDWFDGKGVLADRYGLPRFEVRIRVLEVVANLGSSEDEPYIVKGEGREFKTQKGADAYAGWLVSRGAVVLYQYAPLLWLTDAEMPAVTNNGS